MLGQLYCPSGKALEHARVVLELEDPHAVNVAYGCSVGCSYCYGPRASRQSRENWMKVRYPKDYPVELVKKQLTKSPLVDGTEVKGVFISFMTDPYLPLVRKLTEPLIKYLIDQGIRVATSSKLEVSDVPDVRNGMTIVSLDRTFWEMYEHQAPTPISRLLDLKKAHEGGEYTWTSIEPCPCKGIWTQDITHLLDALHFVDLIVLGMWNYDRRARTDEAREDYRRIICIFRDFCKEHGIRYHIKSDTLDFIGENVVEVSE
uniref:Radical SAM superfamily protein n=1 Tax=viral metagenome TaxID=1070528 RepID=A0A6M3MFL9_9ZZZZ